MPHFASLLPRVDVNSAGMADRAVWKTHSKASRASSIVEALRASKLKCHPQRGAVHPATVIKNRDRECFPEPVPKNTDRHLLGSRLERVIDQLGQCGGR